VLRRLRVEAVWYAGSFAGGGPAGGQGKLTPAEVRILPPLVYVRLKMARGHRVAEGWHFRKLPYVITPSRNVELREEAGEPRNFPSRFPESPERPSIRNYMWWSSQIVETHPKAAGSFLWYRGAVQVVGLFLAALLLVVILVGLMFWYFFLRGRWP
jgi:hypothetical protein